MTSSSSASIDDVSLFMHVEADQVIAESSDFSDNLNFTIVFVLGEVHKSRDCFANQLSRGCPLGLREAILQLVLRLILGLRLVLGLVSRLVLRLELGLELGLVDRLGLLIHVMLLRCALEEVALIVVRSFIVIHMRLRLRPKFRLSAELWWKIRSHPLSVLISKSTFLPNHSICQHFFRAEQARDVYWTIQVLLRESSIFDDTNCKFMYTQSFFLYSLYR